MEEGIGFVLFITVLTSAILGFTWSVDDSRGRGDIFILKCLTTTLGFSNLIWTIKNFVAQ